MLISRLSEKIFLKLGKIGCDRSLVRLVAHSPVSRVTSILH
jgi:hypothetical protein